MIVLKNNNQEENNNHYKTKTHNIKYTIHNYTVSNVKSINTFEHLNEHCKEVI